MDTISESSMVMSLVALGGIAIVHYNNTPSDQYSIIRSAKSRRIPFASDPIFKSPSDFIDSGDDFASSPCVFVTRNGDSNGGGGSSRYDFDQAASFPLRNAVDQAPLVSEEDGEVVDVFSAEDVERIRGFPKLGLPSLGADGDFMVGATMGTREEDKERLEHLVKVGANVVIVFVVGGHIDHGNSDKGNVFTVSSNKYAEFNMFLDPLAAKIVLDSKLNITHIPLAIQRQVSSFSRIIKQLQLRQKTVEAVFARRLLSRLYPLKQKHQRYQHMDTFLGEKIN
ncbi:hypothetical protein Syun_023145 [Stephania yunnanensis]|uniref:IMP dehydrogenase/GMP reductase domain-containing protein n=1 Tax=Stephania yunnanensis TaxID=152371 RepID=A0AAP0F927_9MAGN